MRKTETKKTTIASTKNAAPRPTALAKVYRGGIVESIHYGSVAVVDAKGKLKYYAGNPNVVTFFRSASKPFQVLALIEEGGVERHGFTAEEIAIMAGSHSGQPEHIAVVDRILQKVEISEADLQCGTHIPLYYAVHNKTPEAKRKFDQRYHNCSGKHSGMIALSLIMGENKADYLDRKSKAQRRILRSVSEICQIPASRIVLGTDGCSAPNFAVPLKNMALGFARLASASKLKGKFGMAMQKVLLAMVEHPLMVSGEKRLDYILAQNFSGRVVAKAGAEAVECFGLTDKGWGVAIKIDDGSSRAMAPVVFSVLKQLGYKIDTEKLKDYVRLPVKNYRRTVVGQIEASVKLEKAGV